MPDDENYFRENFKARVSRVLLRWTFFGMNFFKWAILGLFLIYNVFWNKHYNSYDKYMWKNVMTIQYTALVFEPMTFGTWVSSHNH